MKVTNSIWFTPMGVTQPIGVIIGETDVGEQKAYIGLGTGFNEEIDIEAIKMNGAKFPIEAAKVLFNIK